MNFIVSLPSGTRCGSAAQGYQIAPAKLGSVSSSWMPAAPAGEAKAQSIAVQIQNVLIAKMAPNFGDTNNLIEGDGIVSLIQKRMSA
jgi:hypothetical protein